MLDLLQNYSIADILIFVVVLALAIKGIVSFGDWAMDRSRKFFHKETEAEKKQQAIQQRFDRNDAILKTLSENQDNIQKDIQTLTHNINVLIESDRDDIKSYITEKHHIFCYEKKWIDKHSLECLEKRYSHYVEEGGNSFVELLMSELRALPKCPPDEEKE